MDCPKCGGNVYCKDGIVQGRQRYLCKGCRYRYTVEQRSGTGDKATRRQALELYLEGLGFRSIGRILKLVMSLYSTGSRHLVKPCLRLNGMSLYR